MAEGINALILPIGADPSQFQKSINDVKNSIKELGSTISATPFNLVSTEQKNNLAQLQNTLKSLTNDLKEFGKAAEPAANSIAGLDKKIKELNAQKITLDAKTSASEIARLTKEIEKLTEKRNNIDALGASVQQIGQIGSTSFKKVQDNSKGARTALTSLSLVAQDLPFGFIAIQNNLPGVIQSFGQLATQAGGNVAALKALGASLIGPAGVFLAFSIVTGAVTVLVQKYGSLTEAAKVLLGSSQALTEAQKSFNKAISETTGSLTTEQGKVEALTKTLLNQKAPQSDRLAAYNELIKLGPEIIAGVSKENALTAEGNLLIQANAEARKELLRLKIQEAGITNALTTSATQLSEKRLEETKLLAREKVELDKYNKSLKDQPTSARVAEQGINTYSLQLKQTRSDLSAVREEIKLLETEQNSYLLQLDPITNSIAQNNYQTSLKIEALKKEQEELRNSIKANEDWAKASAKSFANQPFFDAQEGFSKYVEGATRLNVNSIKKFVEENRKNRVILTKELQTQPPSLNIQQGFIDQQGIAASFTLAKETIDLAFFNPLSKSFEDFLTTGKFTFQEFSKVVLTNIKRIVAQIAASKILEVLTGIFAGPLAGGFAGGGSFLSNIGGLLPNLRRRQSFDNIRPNVPGLGGTVNFVIRGTELVGVLNRGNQEISRIG